MPSVAPEEREDKLRAIIVDIQRQHAIIRKNIIKESKASLLSLQLPNHSTNGTSSDGELSDKSLDALFQSMSTQHDPSKGDIYKVPSTSHQSKSEIDLAIEAANAQRAATAKWTNEPQIDALLRTFEVYNAERLRFYREALVRRLGRDSSEAQAAMDAQTRLEAELPLERDQTATIHNSSSTKPAAQTDTVSANNAAPRGRESLHNQNDASGRPPPQSTNGIQPPKQYTSMQVPPPITGTKRPASMMRSSSEANTGNSPYLERRERVPGGQNPSLRRGASTDRNANTTQLPRLHTMGIAPGGPGMIRSASEAQQPRLYSNNRWDAATDDRGNRSVTNQQSRASTTVDRSRDPRPRKATG